MSSLSDDTRTHPWTLTPAEPWPGSADRLGSVPGGWTGRLFQRGDLRLRITVPARPDDLLDDPDVLAANRRDDYMPYWGYLWQAAGPMTAAVLRAEWPAGAEALEIGSGVGLVGLAGLARGLRVAFSDYDATSVALSVFNAEKNGWPGTEGLVLDWRQPLDRRFPVIFGSDVTYERRNHGPILDVLDRMLSPGGVCWIGDAGRQVSAEFLPAARERGYRVSLRDELGKELGEPQVGRFQLFELTTRP